MKQRRILSTGLSFLLILLQVVYLLPQAIQAVPFDNSQGDIVMTEKMNGQSGYFVGRIYDIPFIQLWRYPGGTLPNTAHLYHVENLHARGELDFLAHGFCIQQDVSLVHFRVGKGGAYSYDWTSNWSKGNSATQTMLGRIAYYGWESSPKDKRSYATTQGALWTYLGGAESHHFLDLANNNLQAPIEEVLHKAATHLDVPQFTGAGWNEATRTLKMKPGESVVLTPTSGSPDVSESKLRVNVPGISVSGSGNKLVIASEANVDTSTKHQLDISRINPNVRNLSYAFLEHLYSQDVMFSNGIDPANYTINVEFEASGQLEISKTDEDTGSALDGAEFQLLNESGAVTKVAQVSPGHYTTVNGTLDVIKTQGGKAKVEGLPAGNYSLKETKVPSGYATPINATHAVVIQNNHLSHITITNKELLAELKIIKVDGDTSERIPVTGIRFQLYSSPTSSAPIEVGGTTVFTTDANGSASLKNLKAGTYYIEEIEAPEGYILPTGRTEVSLSRGALVELIIQNKPQMGRIKIEKTGAVLSGYSFEEVSVEKSNKMKRHPVLVEVPQSFEEEADIVVPLDTSFIPAQDIEEPTEEASTAITETNPGDMTDLTESMPDESTAITESSSEESSSEETPAEPDLLSSRYMNLPIKLSADKPIAQPTEETTQIDFIYQIVDRDTGAVVIPEVKPVDGVLHLELLNGRYEAVSTNKPSEVIQVEFDVYQTTIETHTLQKLVPHFTEGSLERATYEIYAAEDIYSGSASFINDRWEKKLLHEKGSLIDTLTTGESGIAISKDIPLGSYRIKETHAPPGYVLNPEEHLVTLAYEGQQVSITEVSSSYTNERQKLTVNFEKSFAESQWFHYHQEAPQETLFSLYNINSYSENGVTVPSGTLLDTSPLTLQDGKWMAEFHPFFAGDFEIRELHTNEAYRLSDPLAFTLSYADNVEHISSSLDEFINELVSTDVEITKVDSEDERPLAGVVFELISLHENGEEVIASYSTDEDGKIHISGLEYGRYILKEVVHHDGYATPKRDRHDVTVDASGQLIELRVENEPTKVRFMKLDFASSKELPGAHLSIRDSAGNIIEEWISTDEPYIVKRLKVGETYTLTEDLAPLGYATAQSIQFTILDTGEIQAVEMVNDYTWIDIVKVDAGTGLIVESAELRLLSFDGEIIDEWISSSAPHTIRGLEVGETYVIEEVKAPEGYVSAPETLTFKVEDTREIQLVAFENEPTKVTLSKRDITTDEELPGAHLSLRDSSGNLVEEWVSTDEPYLIEYLTVGETYTLAEDLAPLGYATASSIEFIVQDTADIQPVIMKDEATKVSISKRDITTDEELPGAHLSLRDSSGNLVEEWVSTDEPYLIEYLTVGETYTLVEDLAPLGYASASSIEFTVQDTADIQAVVMKDEPTAALILKTDPTGRPLPGAIFELRHKGGEVVADDVYQVVGTEDHLITDEKGVAEIHFLPQGEYEVREIKAPIGYIKDHSVHDLQILESNSLSNPAEITVTNEPEVADVPSAGDGLRKYIIIGAFTMTGLSSLLYGTVVRRRQRER